MLTAGARDATGATSGMVTWFFMHPSLPTGTTGFVVAGRLGFSLRQAERNAAFKGFHAIRFVADVTDLMAFASGRAFVIQEVAKLAQRLAVGVRYRIRRSTTGRRLGVNTHCDARRELRFAFLVVPGVANVVAVADGTGTFVRVVAQRTEGFAGSRPFAVSCLATLSFAAVRAVG